MTILFLILICAHPVQSQEADTPVQEYASTKLPELARSYWRLNNLDTKNNQLIDQYLMITECVIYQKYFSNDFEWNKIRVATKDYIDTYRNRFPTRFEFTQPIYLDRYDFEKNGFPLKEASKIDLASRIQVAGNQVGDYPCLNRNYREQDFPPAAVMTVPKPFSYMVVKTDQAKADAFVEYVEKKRFDTGKGRPAYMQYRIKVDKSMPPIMNGRQAMANLFGSIESIRVYADREKTILLEEIKF